MTTSTVRRNRILVVDDEPDVCETIGMLLTFDGHTVKTAGSAEEALEVGRESGLRSEQLTEFLEQRFAEGRSD